MYKVSFKVTYQFSVCILSAYIYSTIFIWPMGENFCKNVRFSFQNYLILDITPVGNDTLLYL